MKLKRRKPAEEKKAEPAIENQADLSTQTDSSNSQKDLKQSLFAGDDAAEHEEAEAGSDSSDNVVSGRKPSRSGKVMVVSTAFCLLAALACFGLIRFKADLVSFVNGSQKLEPVTAITRPVPWPDCREALDFLLAYEVDGQRMVTSMRMEIGFQSPTRFQNFKECNVAFRDAIYAFLLKQNLYGNSVQSWRSIVEKEMLDCLRVKLPQSYPDRILLTQVENL